MDGKRWKVKKEKEENETKREGEAERYEVQQGAKGGIWSKNQATLTHTVFCGFQS